MSEATLKSDAVTRWVQAISYWFAAAAAIIYATGFLVEFTFLNSLGVRDPGLEAFRAKYIYVGLLCLLSPVSCGVFILGCLRIRQLGGPFYWSSVLIVFNMFLVFYLLNTIAPPGFFTSHEWNIALVFGAFMIILGAIRFLDTGKKLALFRAVRWILLVLAGVCSFGIYRDLACVILEVFVEGGWLYLCLVVTIIFVVGWLARVLLHQWSTTMLITSTSLQITLIYLSILVFAYRIYPYIPAERGGGDFSRPAALTTFTFNPSLRDAVPPDLIEKTDFAAVQTAGASNQSGVFASKPLIVVTETSSGFCVAVPGSANDLNKLRQELQNWRHPGIDTKPKKIYELSRQLVLSQTSWSPQAPVGPNEASQSRDAGGPPPSR